MGAQPTNEEIADAYSKWLGIPRIEQPPNAYRLLGIELFEPDSDAIHAAADRQSAQVRTHQSGPQSNVSEYVLNQVAAARACLIRPDKRREYDARLRQQLAARASQSQLALPAESRPAADVQRATTAQTPPPRRLQNPAPLVASAAPATQPIAEAKPKSSKATWTYGAAGGVAVIAIAAAAILLSRHGQPAGSTASPTVVPSVAPAVALNSVSSQPAPQQLPPSPSDDEENPPESDNPTPNDTTKKKSHSKHNSKSHSKSHKDNKTPTGPEQTAAANVSPKVPANVPGDLADMIARVEESVVRIDTVGEQFRATGSGFIVDDSTTIVTNFHVIDGARSVEVEFHDGHKARAIGYLAADPAKDLAVLQIDATKPAHPPIGLASRLPRQGDHVYAIGTPVGFSFSVSDGIVSAIRTGAKLHSLGAAGEGLSSSTTWIQTTAPISHGNSGGPLVNSDGEVVGVNTRSRVDAQNLNFAISAADVRRILNGRSIVKDFSILPKSVHYSNATPRNSAGEPPLIPVGNEQIRLPSGTYLDVATMFRTATMHDLGLLGLRIAGTHGLVESSSSDNQFVFMATEQRGALDGLVIASYSYGTKSPAIYATYSGGSIDGMLLSWREDGTRQLFAQFSKGNKSGVLCLFDDSNRLRFIQELKHDEPQWSYILNDGTVAKTFHADKKAATDDEVKAASADVDKAFADTKVLLRKVKKAVNDLDEQQRRELAAANSAAARQRILDRNSGRDANRERIISTLERLYGL